MPNQNRLAQETSPYLRQHADNPVDWYPWGDEAFAAAKERDVPVLLSVGYSACHWCHVMAHESFEDSGTAAIMNDLFVNVKVDREERPDVDAIYMDAVQAMSGNGGWPMTVFLTPDAKPFFGGTYFPKDSRGGMISFTELCRRIDDVWQNQRSDLDEQADELTNAIAGSSGLEPGDGLPGTEVLTRAVQHLQETFDPAWGGFGSAPKFPQTMSLDLLLRSYQESGSAQSLEVVTTSLDAMASGGIYDHLGGGFARYSTDQQWLVPHFEKMLYDEALLTRVYLHAWQVTGNPTYRQVVDETISYVLRELRHPLGGFFSAEDADSEGVEGKFYVWSVDELTEVLGADAPAVIDWYGASPRGNFEGANILWRGAQRGDLLRPAEIEAGRQKLFDVREGRIRPGLDDKVLTEWNGLMLSGLAEAAAATGTAAWLDLAIRSADFLRRHLRRDDGRWLRSWQGERDAGPQAGRAQHLGYAGDYGAMLDAFTRLAEASGRAEWIAEARATADGLLDLFWDDQNGGVFTTGSDAPALVTRPKDLMDNALPSANSLAAVGLLRLAALTGETRYQDAAESILVLLGPLAAKHPQAFGHLLAAVDLASAGITEVAVTGTDRRLVDEVQHAFRPHVVLTWGERFDSPLWEGRADDRNLAYVCRNYACQAPVDTPEALREQLSSSP